LQQIVKKSLKDEVETGAADITLLNLSQKLFHPYRILIMKNLMYQSEAEFQELKQTYSLSDGNLASHLRALESEGYISFRKDVQGKKVRTYYFITRKGFDAFSQLAEEMRKVLHIDIQQ
jgi:DNA-binding HxlR family transcriptional regulator